MLLVKTISVTILNNKNVYAGSIFIEGIDTVCDQKIIQEKSAILKNVLNYTKTSCIKFYTKMYQYSYLFSR